MPSKEAARLKDLQVHARMIEIHNFNSAWRSRWKARPVKSHPPQCNTPSVLRLLSNPKPSNSTEEKVLSDASATLPSSNPIRVSMSSLATTLVELALKFTVRLI